MSKREQLQKWRESPKVNFLLEILQSTSNPNSFDENEKLFILPRKLLQGLDTLVKKLTLLMTFSKKKSYNRWNLKMNYILSEMSYISKNASIDDINVESSEVTPLKSTLTEPLMNRSRIVHIENTETNILKPEIQRVQNFTAEIKTACAKTSSSCGISVDKASIAVQVVCNKLYQHKYYKKSRRAAE